MKKTPLFQKQNIGDYPELDSPRLAIYPAKRQAGFLTWGALALCGIVMSAMVIAVDLNGWFVLIQEFCDAFLFGGGNGGTFVRGLCAILGFCFIFALLIRR